MPNLALPPITKLRLFALARVLLAVCLGAVSDPRLGAQASISSEAPTDHEVHEGQSGFVYIVGDVLRPGAFLVDPAQQLTLVQALTLAGGPSPSAALTKAVLIRTQKGGRTVSTLNLKRLLRGQDPDPPVRDRDILFVPDSTVKSLWRRGRE